MTFPASTLVSSRVTADGDIVRREYDLGHRTVASSIALGHEPGPDLLGAWWSAQRAGATPRAEGGRERAVRTVDLFCGPGGLAVGFGYAAAEFGHDVVAAGACDQDAEALQVYAANHGARRRSTRSVSALVDHQVMGAGNGARFVYEPEIVDDTWADLLGSVDAVLAGPPCQGHSNLNNRTRRSDRRNELYLTVPAMAIALSAPIVVIENVPAIVHDRRQVVQSAARLLNDAGYNVELGVVSAARLGWPQNRQRFFLIARRDIAPFPLKDVEAALADGQRSIMWAIEDILDRPFDDRMHLDTELSEENRRRIEYLFEHDLHDLPSAERPECHREGTTYNAVYGRLFEDRPAPTITTGFMTPGRGRYIHPRLPRTLTPLEAARLQGFPDTYRFIVDPSLPPSKYKLAKWLGDAVPTPLGHAAGIAVLGPSTDW